MAGLARESHTRRAPAIRATFRGLCQLADRAEASSPYAILPSRLEAAVRSSGSVIRWFSIAALLTAVALSFVELVAYLRGGARFPQGLEVAGIQVGGLTPEEAG